MILSTVVQSYPKIMANDIYMTGKDKNGAMAMQLFPKIVQLHDMLSSRSRSPVEISSDSSQTILLHFDLLAPYCPWLV